MQKATGSVEATGDAWSQPVVPKPLARSRWPLFAGLVAIGIAQAVGAIGTGLLVQHAFDRLVSGVAPVTATVVLVLAGGLALTVGLTAVMRAQERVTAERLGQAYVLEVRSVLFRHLTRVPARDLGHKNRGSMLQKFVGDLSALRSWVSLGLARLLVAGIAVGLAVVALSFMNVMLGVSIAAVLALGALATYFTSARLLRTSREARKRRARLTGEVSERLSHVGVLQASGQERRERRRVGKHSNKVAAAMIDKARASGMTRAIAEGTAGLATVAALLVGAAEVRSGRATPGTVVAAATVAGLLAGHLRDLGRVAEYAAGAVVARDAVRRFLALPRLPDAAGLPDLGPAAGRLELDGVTLDGALVDVTVTAEPGQVVAVVGPNGAGKSTLVSVAARLVDPDRGTVRLDGQDIRACSLSSVRAAIGVAGPDLPLLRGSVGRNVRYRVPKADEAEVARVSALCGLEGLLDELPGGWKADVGEGGSRLSAGQRARLTVARAVLGRPPLLILDEAEAHLDRDAAGVVDRVLADHSGTALIVTHRRELAERADVVWCLHDGHLVEAGPPDELLAGSGPTARLLGYRREASEPSAEPLQSTGSGAHAGLGQHS